MEVRQLMAYLGAQALHPCLIHKLHPLVLPYKHAMVLQYSLLFAHRGL